MVLVELGRKRIGWSNLCKRFNIHTFEIRIFSSKNFISRSFVEEKVEILSPEDDCFAKKLGNSEKNKGWNGKGRKSLGWSMFSPAKPSQRTLEISAPVRGTILASRIAWVQHTQRAWMHKGCKVPPAESGPGARAQEVCKAVGKTASPFLLSSFLRSQGSDAFLNPAPLYLTRNNSPCRYTGCIDQISKVDFFCSKFFFFSFTNEIDRK